jgi:signal transduction histidine kinase
MSDVSPPIISLSGAPRGDLEVVLDAWQAATSRLEATHESLRMEVRRLSDELEIKNRELARKNRLADLGQMASHIAHEVRNSLVPVALYLSLLRRRLSDDAGSIGVLEKIESGFTAVDATVNDLLQFTAERDPRRELVDIRELLNELEASLAPQISAQSIRLVTSVPLRITIFADREMLRRSIMNLLLNALDAMPDGGELTITVYGDHGWMELEVADSGPGLTDEARRRAFEPFFTTKSHGTGLGLAIVYRIAEVHGGQVTAMNCPEGGAAFTLRLPRWTKEMQMEAAA